MVEQGEVVFAGEAVEMRLHFPFLVEVGEVEAEVVDQLVHEVIQVVVGLGVSVEMVTVADETLVWGVRNALGDMSFLDGPGPCPWLCNHLYDRPVWMVCNVGHRHTRWGFAYLVHDYAVVGSKLATYPVWIPISEVNDEVQVKILN